MNAKNLNGSRRRFIAGLGTGAALVGASRWFEPGVLANELERRQPTPQVTEGPFYPDKMPLDTDNDLLLVNDSITPGVGEITHLSGRIFTTAGSPLRNAYIEVWQVDNQGFYFNTRDPNFSRRDANFQGYGRFLTDSSGAYYFRTIKPVPYSGRTPHIHVAVSQNGRRIFTTQILINGHPQNQRDMVFQSVRDPEQRKLLLADFTPIADSRIGELAVNFDIVLGVTPRDAHDEPVKGGIGASEMQRHPRGRGPGPGGEPGRGPGPGFGPGPGLGFGPQPPE